MAQAIDVLMDEHRVIERVLGALEAYAGELSPARALERGPVLEFARFFKTFADAFHHGKEERLLFERMVEFGFPREGGPLAVMLLEHEMGRKHVAVLAAIGEGAGRPAPGERDTFAAHSRDFASLLRSHIVKEDQILYPMALQCLPGAELDRLAEQYAEFQEKVVGTAGYDEMLRLADRLVAAHPAEAAVASRR